MTWSIHTMEPTGWTGGRVYLRMTHDSVRDIAPIATVPDLKRRYRHRRWRRLRHLATLAPRVRRLHHSPGVFIWDDLSLLAFTRPMRARTIFLFHHHDPLQYDSWPVEPLLWQRLFTAMRDCAAVVCVSPHWADRLAHHGIAAQVIHNAFDTALLDEIRREDRANLKRRFGLPPDRVGVYLGKAVHGKGIEQAHALLSGHPDLHLVTTGNNTIGARTHHLGWLPYPDHLRVIRACDIGVFLPDLHEGWSRCAAEAVLLDLPCLTNHRAGLGDLSTIAALPRADLTRLADQIRAHAGTRPDRTALSRYDLAYFTDAWHHLVNTVRSGSDTLTSRDC